MLLPYYHHRGGAGCSSVFAVVRALFFFFLSSSFLNGIHAQLGQDYIRQAPTTVYETGMAQQDDYDSVNQQFRAHPIWLNDRLIHSYSFMRYTPETYPGLITEDASFRDVPVQRLFLITTTGDWSGVVGQPILEFHTADGNAYSDFVRIVFVTVSTDAYTADLYKSVRDITNSVTTEEDNSLQETTVYANMPVVPTGASLQHPRGFGGAAPIQPTTVWYKGVQVSTFLFEVTDARAALHFAASRDDPSDSAFGSTVSNFASVDGVFAIPKWHLNQYTQGVMIDDNNNNNGGGGPNPSGMRDIVNLDRADRGYSPLKQLVWVTELPINYQPNQVSSFIPLISQPVFSLSRIPHFVNVPLIGTASAEDNPDLKLNGFQQNITTGSSSWILGSPVSLLQQEGVRVTFETLTGESLGSTLTNAAGAFQYELGPGEVPPNTPQVRVVAPDGQVLREIDVTVTPVEEAPSPAPSSAPVVSSPTTPAPSLGNVGGGDDDDDYLDTEPLTIYEQEQQTQTYQNLDYDSTNNMFVAHKAWLNDREISYYKFRVYSPETYASLTSLNDVPLQRLYIATQTSGRLEGAVGRPILQYHSSDGVEYSDFVEIHLVTVGSDYAVDTFRSVGDITASGASVQATGIVVNMPQVPLNSKLQDPRQSDSKRAPIDPVEVWYRGVLVWTYVFEVNDSSAASYFQYTRTEDGFDIAVAPFATGRFGLKAIPAWHLNQFTNGVTDANAGGPSPSGMRNVIRTDRAGVGYSPLWQIRWVTEVPMDFVASDVSHADTLVEESGFLVEDTLLFVNCPTVGAVGSEENPDKKTSFLANTLSAGKETSFVAGSPTSTILEPGIFVTFQANTGETLGTVQTNTMGAYEFEVIINAMPSAAREIYVLLNNERIRTLVLRDYISRPPPITFYEDGTNQDFDSENNMFIAHPVWFQNRETHYYRFTTYTPERYPGLIQATSAANDVPRQRIYIVTNAGWSQIIGKPIIQYHPGDGTAYSDFMEVHFVTPPQGYTADTFRSEGDILDSGASFLGTGTVLNIPVVPTGAVLQDPARKGTRALDIEPVLVWYRGVEVWTYIFETTDQIAANYYSWTRPQSLESVYSVSSSQFVNLQGELLAARLFYFNHFTNGVSTEKGNGGGPDPLGMRNVISVDRTGQDYTSLWQTSWITAPPLNHFADDVSSADDVTVFNGFSFVQVPFFANCPMVGAIRQLVNPDKKGEFQTLINPFDTVTYVLGSDESLVMKEGVSVELQVASGRAVSVTTTNSQGGFEFRLPATALPLSATQLSIVANSQTIHVVPIDTSELDNDGSSTDRQQGLLGLLVAWLVSVVLPLI